MAVSASLLAALLITTLMASALLVRERACWRRAASHLGPKDVGNIRPTWLMVGYTVGAFVLCGLAIVQVKAEESTGDRGALVLLVDVSRSMYTADIPPNRLERAKQVLDRALKHAAGWRVGVVAFAGDASLVCPLTVDHDAVHTALQSLGGDNVSLNGTAIGEGIGEALKPLSGRSNGAVLLVSDGENLEGSPEAPLLGARSIGVPIHVLAIGTVEGAGVPDRRAEGQQQAEPAGAPISRLNAPLLQHLASDTGGRYLSVDQVSAIFADAGGHRPASPVTGGPWGRISEYLVLIALGLLSVEAFLRSRPS